MFCFYQLELSCNYRNWY